MPFDTDSFDAVLAALVMHYLPDWVPTLREFHRILRPGGRVVISTHHPFMDHQLAGGENHFETYDSTETWQRGHHRAQLRFWHRPLSAMTGALDEAGFDTQVLDEPLPDPRAREIDPHAWQVLTTRPRFLFLSATAG